MLKEIPQIRREQGPYSPDAMLRVVQNLQLSVIIRRHTTLRAILICRPVNDTIETVEPVFTPGTLGGISAGPPAPLPQVQDWIDPVSFGDDTQDLLWNLTQNVPDVARLFDGSLGVFEWTTM